MQRILVIRGGALGDVILTLPAIGALRLTFPRAHIEIAGDSKRLCLAHHPAYADAITDVEKLAMHRLFSHQVREPVHLSSFLRAFDLILSYVPSPNPVFTDNLMRYCLGETIVWPPHPEGSIHAADHLLRPVLDFADTTPPTNPRVYPEARDRQAANRFWQSAGLPERGVLAVHAGSGGLHKLWPQEGWRQVLAWAANNGLPGILICGPAEQERGIGPLLPALGSTWKVLRNAQLMELAGILEKCAVFAGHDSGVTHLAAAVGTRTLALFGPTDPRVWAPRARHACVMQPAFPGPLGLDNMPVRAVTERLRALLDGTLPLDQSEMGHTRLQFQP